MGTAERDNSTPKAAGVKQIIAGRTLNAVSDGAFAATPQDRTAKHSMRN